MSQNVKNNGSLYIHTYLVPWTDPDRSTRQLLLSLDGTVVHSSRRLNKYKKRFFVRTQNLLTGETTTSKEDIEVFQLQYSRISRINNL